MMLMMMMIFLLLVWYDYDCDCDLWWWWWLVLNHQLFESAWSRPLIIWHYLQAVPSGTWNELYTTALESVRDRQTDRRGATLNAPSWGPAKYVRTTNTSNKHLTCYILQLYYHRRSRHRLHRHVFNFHCGRRAEIKESTAVRLPGRMS